MADQRRVVDVAHRHAVVVDDDDVLALFVDLLAFQQALLVGIDDDQQRIRRDDVERLIGCDKVVALACIKKSLEQRPCERSLAVDGDDRGHIAHFADAQHADGGATASRSLMRCPMMITLSLRLMRSHSALAIMRLRTWLRFSTPWEIPP